MSTKCVCSPFFAIWLHKSFHCYICSGGCAIGWLLFRLCIALMHASLDSAMRSKCKVRLILKRLILTVADFLFCIWCCFVIFVCFFFIRFSTAFHTLRVCACTETQIHIEKWFAVIRSGLFQSLHSENSCDANIKPIHISVSTIKV